MIEDRIITEKKKTSVGALTIFTVIIIIAIIAGIFYLLKAIGEKALHTPVAGLERNSVVIVDPAGSNAEDLPEGHVMYDGKEYALNPDLICILVMGLDVENYTEVGGQSWDAAPDAYNTGGQADSLFLVLLNPHTEEISLVSINRNSMADVDVWDESGTYRGVFTEQIALQHGFGNDPVKCAEHQVVAVSRMLHGIPIHAYAAVSMDAVPELNDAVGGITVEVLDDIVYPEYDMDLHQGETVTLKGDKAYWYLRLRNEDQFDSNSLRLERQKQYITAFVNKARESVHGDIGTAVDLFNIMQKYMTTDLNVSSYTYLASETMDYKLDPKGIYSVTGETVQGVLFEEFYIDDEALQKLLIELFYEPVN